MGFVANFGIVTINKKGGQLPSFFFAMDFILVLVQFMHKNIFMAIKAFD